MGFQAVRVEADSGNIGGNKSHEFHILSNQGFDDLLTCPLCFYSANVEKARSRFSSQTFEELTPFWKSFLDSLHLTLLPTSQFSFHLLKSSLQTTAETRFALVILGAGRVPQPLAVKCMVVGFVLFYLASFGWDDVHIVGTDRLQEHAKNVLDASICVDANSASAFTSLNGNLASQITFGNFALARKGDLCPNESCSGSLNQLKGVEVGHVFYLGTKYSKILDAVVTHPEGGKRPIEMGCFGIGLSRLLAAAVETSHDADGMIWPSQIAPYRAIVVSSADKNIEKCIELYREISNLPGWSNEVVLDDRDQTEHRFGAKFKDALLIGFPYIIVGGKSLENNLFEVQERRTGKKHYFSNKQIIELFQNTQFL